MTRGQKISAIGGLVACVSVGVLIYHLENPEAPPSGNAKRTPVVQHKSLDPQNPKGHPPRSALLENNRPPPVALDSLQQFLTDHHGSPAALAAAFDLTGDVNILRDGLAKNPDSPELLWRLAAASDNPEERLHSASNYVRLLPNQSLGYYLMASALLASGKHDAALESLASGLKHAPPESTAAKDVLLRRQAWESLGYSATQARILGFYGESDNACIAATMSPLKWIAEGLQSKSDPALAELGASCAEHFRIKKNMQISDELIAISFQQRFLPQLPPDTEWGETGMTVQEKRLQVDKDMASLTGLVKEGVAFAEKASEKELANYYDAALAEGGFSALKKLVQENHK
jgi:tetratricopeptide (TPR) repeat protein